MLKIKVACFFLGHGVYTVSKKKEATLIFHITSPSVEIFLQFLKPFVQEQFMHGKV